MPLDLPPEVRLDSQSAPTEFRAWLESSVTQPLNRALSATRALLAGGLSLGANLDTQALTKTLTAPASWATLEFPSALRGACAGVLLAKVVALDSAGKPSGALPGTLSVPHWDEVVDRAGARTIRILDQHGLTAGVRYAVTWRALGE